MDLEQELFNTPEAPLPAEIDVSRSIFESRHHPSFTHEIVASRSLRPPWLFSDLLVSRTLTMLSGEPYSGKTLLALAMVLSIDSQRPLSGHYTPISGRACFIGQDAPTWDYHAAVRSLWTGYGLSHTDPGSSLFFFNRGYKITDPNFPSFITQLVELYGVNFLVLDCFIDFHSLDENNTQQMRAVTEVLKSLRDQHLLSILFTHHTSKGAEFVSANYRARGSSVLPSTVDQHISLSSRFNKFILTNPKRRGMSASEGLTFRLHTDSGLRLALDETADLGAFILKRLQAAPESVQSLLTAASTQYPAVSGLDKRLHGTLAILSRYKKVESRSGLWHLIPRKETT